jgi:serpin B
MKVSPLVLALGACAGRVPPDAVPEATAHDLSRSAGPEAFVDANNAFAVDLWNELAGPDANPVIAPASISLALSMVAAGARGEGAEQLRAVLHAPDIDLHIASASAQIGAWNEPNEHYALSVSHALFADQGAVIEPAYQELSRARFAGALRRLDFQASPEPSRATINEWVASRTNQRIPELLPAGSIDETLELVLVNTVWFRGEWGLAFEEASTHLAPFRTERGVVEADMMSQQLVASYAEVDDVQVLELPYRGDHLVMDLVLPRTDARIGPLSLREIERWVGALEPTGVSVSVPRVTLSPPAVDLTEPLVRLGMPTGLDLSGIGPTLQDLDRVLHQVWVRVDERGTEAAAATAVFAVDGLSLVPDAVPFVADHPFLFLIRDARTGAVLFVGEITDPTADPS